MWKYFANDSDLRYLRPLDLEIQEAVSCLSSAEQKLYFYLCKPVLLPCSNDSN